MHYYSNLSGNSSVVAYEYGADFIRVQFNSGYPYVYSYHSAGRNNVEEMKRLANVGQGLCSFINRRVKYNYEQ